MRTDGKADEIVAIGKGMRLIKVIDSPDQATFGIAPRTEIFHMQIADRKHVGSFGKIGTYLGPDLCPAVERGTQERKNACLHVGVFEKKIFRDKSGVLSQPLFKLTGGFDDVHSAEQ